MLQRLLFGYFFHPNKYIKISRYSAKDLQLSKFEQHFLFFKKCCSNHTIEKFLQTKQLQVEKSFENLKVVIKKPQPLNDNKSEKLLFIF